MKVTILGLGLHGGGTGAARFFASRGDDVLVTDLRTPEALAPSLKALEDLEGITYVLGTNRMRDITEAELVIKNSAVRWDNPLLAAAHRIETDISWNLNRITRPLICITGTKGKTTTAYLVHHLLSRKFPLCELAGNMGISLFSLHKTDGPDPLVLELSSWQLRDLRMLGTAIPHRASLLTSLYPDHLENGYTLAQYLKDKEYLFAQDGGWSVIPDNLSLPFSVDRMPVYHAEEIDLGIPGVLGETAGQALLTARHFGMTSQEVLEAAKSFRAPDHRLQPLGVYRGISWFNDSAATIPEAVLRALEAIQPDHLITGGTDKGLSVELFREVIPRCTTVHLLSGSFSKKLMESCIHPFFGPFETMEQAVESALTHARPGDRVLLSPGAASFEGFLNAEDRGYQFINAVKSLGQRDPGHE